MNELEKDPQEQGLDLDAIMKEFGADFADPTEDASEEPADFPEETPEEAPLPSPVPEEEPQKEAAEEILPAESDEEAQTSVSEDTIRLDNISTVVGKPLSDPPLDEEENTWIVVEEEDGYVPEPFSGDWEPDYDEDIGEYVPPEPIVFRPRSRLAQLRKDLVAGPEKRYYDLSEVGLGKLQAAMFVNILVFLLSAGGTALYALELVPPERMRLLVFSQLLAMLISALLGSYQLLDGISDLFRRRFSLNSLLCFTFAACCADGILCLRELRVPCCAAFSLCVTMSLWSAYHKRSTEMGQMDTLRKATRLDGIVKTPDFYEGRPGLLVTEAQVSEFMDTYNHTTGPEKVLSIYALSALLVSMVIGVVTSLLHSPSMGLQICAASLLVSMPASAFITFSRPEAVLERRMHRMGAALCGWQGIRELGKQVCCPVTDQDLFPAGSAKLNGVKFYGKRNPDVIVAFVTAVISAAGGGLVPLFEQLLEGRSGRHYPAEDLKFYPGGGIGGIVGNEPVLVGSLSFLQDMGVDMPEGTKVNQAVYAAIDGELVGVFAISYSKSKLSAMGISTLCSYRGLTPVLTGQDFMLSENFLRSKFSVNTRRMAFPDQATRNALSGVQPPEEAPALAVLTKEGLAPRAYAITGARALRTAWVLGLAVHMVGGILGLVIMALLAYLGTEDLLTPSNMLLYELVWMIPGLLITEWTRSI